jgi:hypothetical protein
LSNFYMMIYHVHFSIGLRNWDLLGRYASELTRVGGKSTESRK